MPLLGEGDCFNIDVHGRCGIRNLAGLWCSKHRVGCVEWEESLWFSPDFYSPVTTLLFLSCLLMRFPVKLKPCPILWNTRSPLLPFFQKRQQDGSITCPGPIDQTGGILPSRTLLLLDSQSLKSALTPICFDWILIHLGSQRMLYSCILAWTDQVFAM